MGQVRGRFGLAMGQRMVGLGRNILKEASAAGYVHRLHAAANAERGGT